MTYFVGFDMGGSTVKYGLVDETGRIFDKSSFNTPKDRAAILAEMEIHVIRYQAQYDIAGVGICVPGIVQPDGYLLTAGAIPSLYNFDLAKTFSKEVGLPVQVENDANAAAIAEHWNGNAKNCDNYIVIVIGTGVGSGIVINGNIYRGAHGMAGEVGWSIAQTIDRTQPLEEDSLNRTVSTVGGLVRRYNLSHKAVDPEAEEELDARNILGLAKAHDPIAEPIVTQFQEDLAIMCINLFSYYDPDRILIGGGISANDEFMHDFQLKLREFIHRHCALNAIYDTALGRVEAAGHRNDAGLIGAVYPFARQKG